MILNLLNQRDLSMTSHEIADLVESRHDSVKRTIERLANQRVIVQPPSVDEHGTDAVGRPRTTQVYVFSGEQGKRDSIIVVAQLSPEFTARLVDRWQELESRQAVALPDFTDPVTAARAWADEVEARKEAMHQLEHAKPAITFVTKYVDSTGLKTFREVCKTLCANELRFREFLVDTKVLYRLNGAWVPYQNHVDARRIVVKAGVSERNGHAFTDVRFTPKGLNWIAGEWGKYQIEPEVGRIAL